nr:exodeoxyribonuclease V subunit alpha [uncultured Glaciecola sp.]
MLFSIPSPIAKKIGYSSCTDCLVALHDIQSIDYYFANNVVMKRYEHETENSFFSDQKLVSQLFHMLLALSYFQRQGHSCLNIKAIAEKTCWSEADIIHYEPTSIKQNTTIKTGFIFANEAELSDIIKRFNAIYPQRKDIQWSQPNLYTGRYANYENEVADFFKQQQKKCIVDSELAFISLQKCADELWPTLFPVKDEHVIDWQQVSVANGLISQTSIISGGAGTGKTYTVARLLLSWLHTQKNGLANQAKLMLAAPTGKAAQRLNESILAEFTQLLGSNKQNQVATLITELMPMIQAKTIHRLLGLGMYGIEPRYNDKKQLDCDFLVIDEVSMIDLAMMTKLLRALPKTAKLVLIGDANQLPSVESGGLLKDLVDQVAWQDALTLSDYSALYSQSHVSLLNQLLPSFPTNNSQRKLSATQCETGIKEDDKENDSKQYNYNHVTFLQKSMRSQNEITQLAQSILLGQSSQFMALLSSKDNESGMSKLDDNSTSGQLSLLTPEAVTPVVTWHKDAYTQKGTIKPELLKQIAQRYACIFESSSVSNAMRLLKGYRLLSATKKGRLGTEFLNTQIEQQLRKRFAHIDVGQTYRGMPIMIVQNDYRLNLFNGDIGVIWTNEEGQLLAYFPDPDMPETQLSFSFTSLPAFELVYAMTIHKTQGSEFEHVDILLPNLLPANAMVHSSQHLSRELLYTGVTRAKKSIGIIASSPVLNDCIGKTSTRFSGLKQKLGL